MAKMGRQLGVVEQELIESNQGAGIIERIIPPRHAPAPPIVRFALSPPPRRFATSPRLWRSLFSPVGRPSVSGVRTGWSAGACPVGGVPVPALPSLLDHGREEPLHLR